MKIDGYQAGKLYETYAGKNEKVGGAGTDESAKPEKTDRVEISSAAAGMNEATSLSSKINTPVSPEQRQVRIDQLKKMIDAGQYNVPSKAVAQSILIGSSLDIKA